MFPYRNSGAPTLRPLDLIAVARHLSATEGSPATDAHLRRAISSAYYAMFHSLAEEAANLIVGRSGSEAASVAWRHAYRALDHATVRTACLNTKVLAHLSTALHEFADLLPRLQSKRHLADYDPHVRFSEIDAIEAIDDCEAAILAFAAAPEAERRAFIAFVLFKTR